MLIEKLSSDYVTVIVFCTYIPHLTACKIGIPGTSIYFLLFSKNLLEIKSLKRSTQCSCNKESHRLALKTVLRVHCKYVMYPTAYSHAESTQRNRLATEKTYTIIIQRTPTRHSFLHILCRSMRNPATASKHYIITTLEILQQTFNIHCVCHKYSYLFLSLGL